MDMSFLLDYAKRVLSKNEMQKLLANNPYHHAPLWHVHGVLGHAWSVIRTAEKLSAVSGHNIVPLAALHDVGKIAQFPAALDLFFKGEDPAPAYAGHEQTSADLAKDFVTPIECKVIGIHHLAYRDVPAEKVVQHLGGDPKTIYMWMLLCAADAVGKGFTPNQKLQRPTIPEKFKQVAKLVHIPENDPTLVVSSAAALSWPGYTKKDIPKFSTHA
jgi:hypothetical protein